MKPSRAVLILLLVMGLCGRAVADIAPRSLEELEQSDAIVVGTIESIRIESERSRIETAFGNYDWAIYLKLKIESVEKGEIADSTLEFRCFRMKSRRSVSESMSFSGHHPIPEVGSRVKVYLIGDEDGWEAVLPNGITSVDAADDEAVFFSEALPDAKEIASLRSLPFTYGLPLELWAIVVVVGLLVFLVPLYFIRRRRRAELSSLQVEQDPHLGGL